MDVDMGFEIKGTLSQSVHAAHVVYAHKHDQYLHIVLMDTNGDLYPSRYAVWSNDSDEKQTALASLQYLVDAMRMDVLKDTDQLINSTDIPYVPETEPTASGHWFVNPCVPHTVSGVSPKQYDNILAQKTGISSDTEIPKAPDVQGDLPPPPVAPYKKDILPEKPPVNGPIPDMNVRGDNPPKDVAISSDTASTAQKKHEDVLPTHPDEDITLQDWSLATEE